jgi:hypothetical protein
MKYDRIDGQSVDLRRCRKDRKAAAVPAWLHQA